MWSIQGDGAVRWLHFGSGASAHGCVLFSVGSCTWSLLMKSQVTPQEQSWGGYMFPDTQTSLLIIPLAHGSYLWLSELISFSHTTSLPINWSSLPAPPWVCSSQDIPWRQMDFWLLPYFTLGLIHHQLFSLFNPPKWQPTFSCYQVWFALNSVPVFSYNSTVIWAQPFSQVSYFPVKIHSQCAIWIIIYAHDCRCSYFIS